MNIEDPNFPVIIEMGLEHVQWLYNSRLQNHVISYKNNNIDKLYTMDVYLDCHRVSHPLHGEHEPMSSAREETSLFSPHLI